MTMTQQSLNRRIFIGASAAVALGATPAFAAASEIYLDKGGVFGKPWSHAVNGMDVVAYFSLADGAAPIAGVEAHKSTYKDATWLFSTAENKAAFDADPDRYRPQYGGYCAWAMARSQLAKGTPSIWYVHEGKLYLNINGRIKKDWLKNIDRDIARANNNWPSVLETA